MMLHDIGEEIMVQDFGNLHKQLDIDCAAVKNLIDVGALAVYPPRELRHRHPTRVEDRFHKTPDMQTAAVLHFACHFRDTT